jgi:glycerate kinase
MTSLEICEILAKTIAEYAPEVEVVSIPIADGGEGTVDAYLEAVGGERRTLRVRGPLGEETDAVYGSLADGTAVIEMAAAAGLALVGDAPDAMAATTYGVGQLIADAVDRGAGSVILGVGGSATSDGGTGALSALGARFRDDAGDDAPPGAAGLSAIRRVDTGGIDPRVRDAELLIACDVSNPLLGERGAARVFAPQKGADLEQVERIESGLSSYSGVVARATGVDYGGTPGFGAAGGIALSLVPFLNARLAPGIDLILDRTGFDRAIEDADLVISGEGKIDAQSAGGKTLSGVARRAARAGTPVLAIVGDVGEGFEALYGEGVTAVFSTNRRAVPFEAARLTAREDLAFLMQSLLRFDSALRRGD